jgi:MFS family permease
MSAHARHGGRQGGAAIVGVLALAAMVVSIMQSQAVPILTLIGAKLHVSASTAGWVTTATLLSAAVMTPLLGRVGDQFGKKRTLVAVLVVAVAGSVIAAVAGNLALLLVGRALQGAATAIFPLALSVLREEIPAKRLHGAMAVVSGMLAFGSGIGIVSTGLLTQGHDPDYRLVFWFAAAAAVVALAGVVFLVPGGGHAAGGKVDVLGAVTLGGFLVLLLLPLSQGHEWGWGSRATLGSFAGAVVMAVVWVLVERRVADPLVDLRMFVHRPVLFTNLAGLFVGFGMFIQFLGVSYLVQMPDRLTGYGFNASILRASCEFLLPSAVASALAAPVGGILVGRLGGRATLVVSGLVGTAGFGWLAFAHASAWSVIAAGIVAGVAISFGYAAMPALIAAGVPYHQSGIANGINSISRTVGSSVASAIFITLLASNPIRHLPAGVPSLPAEGGFTLAFVLGGAAFALTVVVVLAGLRPGRTTASTPADAAEVALPAQPETASGRITA